MKVKNETRYSGVMLRSVFLAAISYVESVLSRDRPATVPQRAAFIRKHCSVTYVYTRRGGCSGWASLGGGRCRIRIAKDEVRLAKLCWLVQHEAYHLFGVQHRDMPDAINNWSAAATAAAADHYRDVIANYGEIVREVAEVEPAKLTTDDKRAKKLESVRASIERWEAKERRATNALKKLRKKERYYAAIVERQDYEMPLAAGNAL